MALIRLKWWHLHKVEEWEKGTILVNDTREVTARRHRVTGKCYFLSYMKNDKEVWCEFGPGHELFFTSTEPKG